MRHCNIIDTVDKGGRGFVCNRIKDSRKVQRLDTHGKGNEKTVTETCIVAGK